MATIRDVARHASVSPATASLVLRDASRVRPRLRKRVEAAIQQLGYKPRPVGRPRQSRRMLHIATVYPGAILHDNGRYKTPTGWWFHAIRQELGKRGHHLTVFGGQSHVDQDPVFQQIVNQREVDGVIMIGIAEDGYLEWVQQRQMPLVVINREPVHNEFSHVSLDNYGGGRQVAEFLFAHGHRRLGMIRLDRKISYSEKRWAGFRDGAKTHGLEPALYEVAIKDNQANYEEVCHMVRQQGITGVFCVGDGMARQCVDAWAAMGVAIPRDLSVVGFDDTGQLTQSGLRLTSVGFDRDAVGQVATDLILALIEGKHRFQSLTGFIPTQLVEHETTCEYIPSGTTRSQPARR